MGTRRAIIHVSRADSPVLLTIIDDTKQFVFVTDVAVSQVLDEVTLLLTLSNLKIILGNI
jgi:hypothetical protein